MELEGLDRYGVEAARLDDVPAIRAVDDIFASAIRSRASDIHLEPAAGGGRVRERIDGVLLETRHLAQTLYVQALSRIKLLASMDIADRRLPQDGRYTLECGGRTYDARVSSMPTVSGEKLAIRLFDARAQIPSLESLGMPPELAARFRVLTGAASGFVVVCGPTGSGKTTTLYSALAERNGHAAHLCSVEDPVEATIPGLAQVQVNARAGLSFASVLRSFLRQDPNAIMIGEMRDAETASVAVSAALCGQLVLTTLHSADAPGAIDRLMELGAGARSLAGALTGVLAQRLLRQLCPQCKRCVPAGEPEAALGIAAGAPVARAAGCDACRSTGYRGRSAAFEFMPMSDAVRHSVESGESANRRRRAAHASGYEPMLAHARTLIARGETSAAEVERVLGGGAFA